MSPPAWGRGQCQWQVWLVTWCSSYSSALRFESWTVGIHVMKHMSSVRQCALESIKAFASVAQKWPWKHRAVPSCNSAGSAIRYRDAGLSFGASQGWSWASSNPQRMLQDQNGILEEVAAKSLPTVLLLFIAWQVLLKYWMELFNWLVCVTRWGSELEARFVPSRRVNLFKTNSMLWWQDSWAAGSQLNKEEKSPKKSFGSKKWCWKNWRHICGL